MPPDHLAVYLTNSCNLACSYCYVAVNQGPVQRLSEEQVRAAVDRFLAAGGRKMTLLGGEPLLDWKLFRAAVVHARERGGRDLVIQTITNGTLLTPEKLEFLNEFDVLTTVSLDGKKDVNDEKRVYFRLQDRSVFEDVMRRLDGLDLSRLGVSLVFTSETVGDLLSNVDFFYRLGFGRIAFNPELYERWPEEKIEVLRCAMDGLRRYYRLVLEGGMRPFVVQMLYAVLENGPKNERAARGEEAPWWHDCHNEVLGPDAKLYACDKHLTFPVGTVPEGVIGEAAGGFAPGARAASYEKPIKWLEERGWGKDEYFCPMGVWFYAAHKGEDPAPLVENFHKVSDAFASGLKAIIEDLKDHPAFQELYVRPRLV